MNAFFYSRVNRNLLGLSLIAVTTLGGCAHSQMNESVNKKLDAQPDIHSTRELTTQAENTIGVSTALSEKQKSQLIGLYRRTHSQLQQMAVDSLRLRELLIAEISEPQYSDDEVSIIKDRLKNTEDKKLSVIFGAVDEANKILGHNPDRNRQILKVFSSLPVEAL